MKLTVVELSTKNHVVMIINWVKICKLNNWKLNIIVSTECYKILKPQLCDVSPYYNLVVLENTQPQNFFKVLRLTKDSNYVILNTVQWHFIFFGALSLLRGCIVSIHNSNSWFQSFKECLIFTIQENRIRGLKKVLKCGTRLTTLLARKVILKASRLVLVSSDNMKRHILNNYNSVKKIIVVPFSLKQQKNYKVSVKEERVSVVYPGSVNTDRKNYTSFLKLVEMYPEVDFFLLGKLPDKQIVDDIVEQLRVVNYKNLIKYDRYLSQKEFDDVMTMADILYSDLNVNYRNEIYGVSKDTGVTYLMSEYSAPLIVNSTFNNLEALDCGTFYFKGVNELQCRLDYFLNNRGMINITRDKINRARRQISEVEVSKTLQDVL